MIKKIKRFSSIILVAVLLPMLTSCWWSGRGSETTTYNGSKTLTNTSYKNLKMNGSSVLNNVQVSGWFNCQGTAELISAIIDGATDVSGSLVTKDGSILKGVVHASKIRAEGTTFGDIFARSDKNVTYRFINSSFQNLYIEGLGDKIVILTNTIAESIVFENPNGIVRLQGNSKVTNVVNGTIEYVTNNATN